MAQALDLETGSAPKVIAPYNAHFKLKLSEKDASDLAEYLKSLLGGRQGRNAELRN